MTSTPTLLARNCEKEKSVSQLRKFLLSLFTKTDLPVRLFSIIKGDNPDSHSAVRPIPRTKNKERASKGQP